ncbi:hypothetical protein PG996_010640 [Apiospora saccharicola]|uniref:Uncharacterized protein n=1 Tax=Apiospora saccharicola TaxID=335842 RepID=A0ABR1URN3_9PEZI
MTPDDQELARRLYEAFRNIVDTFEEQEQNASAIAKGEPTSPPNFSAAVDKAVNHTPDFIVQLLCWMEQDVSTRDYITRNFKPERDLPFSPHKNASAVATA